MEPAAARDPRLDPEAILVELERYLEERGDRSILLEDGRFLVRPLPDDPAVQITFSAVPGVLLGFLPLVAIPDEGSGPAVVELLAAAHTIPLPFEGIARYATSGLDAGLSLVLPMPARFGSDLAEDALEFADDIARAALLDRG